jgi:hypothetical protein
VDTADRVNRRHNLVVDMYARAAMGTKAEDAVAWAERELRKVYEA